MATTLIVPGLHGSEAAHWQSWMEARLEDCLRITQADWTTPELPRWSAQVRQAVAHSAPPVWLIAHSFGCLASIHAVADLPDRVAGAMLVAPADPEIFAVADLLPIRALGFPSVVVASTTDPWMRFTRAAYWAKCWGSRLVSLGAAGHVNVESGFGPWPDGLALFHALQEAHDSLPRGPLDAAGASHLATGGDGTL